MLQQEPFYLDYDGLRELVDRGQYILDATIEPKTMLLLLDCSELGLSKYRSIILDTKYGIILSDKGTTRLINEFIKTCPFGLLLSRTLLPEQKQKQSLPFVWGNAMLVPLGGYTCHSTNWLNLKHTALICFSESDQLHLCFTDNKSVKDPTEERTYHFVLKVNKKIYTINMNNATALKYKLQYLATELTHHLDISIPIPPEHLIQCAKTYPASLKDFNTKHISLLFDLFYREAGISSIDSDFIVKQIKQKYDFL